MSVPGPKRRLGTRVALAFFVLSAGPAVLLGAAAVFVLDELIKNEIDRRSDQVTASTKLMIETEMSSAKRAVESFVESEDFRHTVIEPLSQGDLPAPDDLEAAINKGAKSGGLDLLALVDSKTQPPVILASAHFPASVESPAPPFVKVAALGTSTVGFVHELAAGNPPVWAPALVAVRAVSLGESKSPLLVYGGHRLDTHRLQAIASNGHALLELESPGLRRLVYGSDGEANPLEGSGPAIVVHTLPNGRSKAWAASADESDPNAPTRIHVRVDTKSLERARTTFSWSAAALVAVWLLLAPIAGALLSRPITKPILELSGAAQKIGAGDLDVRITPRSNDEVGALVEVFNHMTWELAESRVRLQRAERIAAWREIARRVAHEIKNPLFPIQMSMETLRKGFKSKHPKLEEIVEESTKTVLEEVRALNRIVTEFSDFARLPAPKLEALGVIDVLEHVGSLYGDKVELDREAIAARGLPKIAVDREQVSRALINLVKNAVEATPAEGGRVVLDAELESKNKREGVRISVSDSGAGIAPEILEKIFTPYFTTKAQGTGLGLAIVERIVQEHQGTIDVESALGKGTTFRVWLPAARG